MTSELHTPSTLADLIDKELMGIDPDSQCVVLDDADWRLITTALRSAVPDVPELVTVERRYMGKHHNPPFIELVRKDSAAEIIAAKDAEVKKWKLVANYEKDVAQSEIEGRKAAEAKLARYEAQEPIGELCRISNKWNVMEIDATFYDDNMHIKDGMKIYASPAPAHIDRNHANIPVTTLYTSPTPAADLKAENELLREALTKISSPTQTADLLWWQVEARAAINLEASNEPVINR